jgi:ribosome-binding protein aMBF1 (putative translation factor)
MEHQDWTTVVLKKRTAKETYVRDPERNEKIRLAKLENGDDTPPQKKRVHPESIQSLIRKRLELGLTQEKADQKCSFARHTIKEIESHKTLPTPSQQSTIQRQFGIQLRIEHI